MTWVFRPDSIIERLSDGTLWTAGHPGYFDLLGGWHFWRLRRRRIGWSVDKDDVWAFKEWPRGMAKIHRVEGKDRKHEG